MQDKIAVFSLLLLRAVCVMFYYIRIESYHSDTGIFQAVW